MGTQLPVKWHGGHMLVEPFPGAGVWALIDTGAGHTASHRKGDGYLGSTLSDIEALAGTRIDMLVGLDAFRGQPVLLTREFVEFGAPQPDGVVVPSRKGTTIMDVDVLRDGWPDTRVSAFFDSGAKHSYIDPDLAEFDGGVSLTEDFFPPIGRYRAIRLSSSVKIGETVVALKPIIPLNVNVAVTSPQRQLLIGSELIRQGDLWIDLAGGKMVWRARDGVSVGGARSGKVDVAGADGNRRDWNGWGEQSDNGWSDYGDARAYRERLRGVVAKAGVGDRPL